MTGPDISAQYSVSFASIINKSYSPVDHVQIFSGPVIYISNMITVRSLYYYEIHCTYIYILHRVVMILVIYINVQWMVQLMMEHCMNLMLQYHYPLRVGRIGH